MKFDSNLTSFWQNFIMPALIGVTEFVEETRQDYNSPITSTFVARMPQFRTTISTLEEVCVY